MNDRTERIDGPSVQRVDGSTGTDPGEGGTGAAANGLPDPGPQDDLMRSMIDERVLQVRDRLRPFADRMTDDELRGWRLTSGRWKEDSALLLDLGAAIIEEVTGVYSGIATDIHLARGILVLGVLLSQVDREFEDRGLE